MTYILLFFRNGFLTNYPGSLDHIDDFLIAFDAQIEPVCVCQDYDYEIIWTAAGYSREEASALLYKHLNNQINGY